MIIGPHLQVCVCVFYRFFSLLCFNLGQGYVGSLTAPNYAASKVLHWCFFSATHSHNVLICSNQSLLLVPSYLNSKNIYIHFENMLRAYLPTFRFDDKPKISWKQKKKKNYLEAKIQKNINTLSCGADVGCSTFVFWSKIRNTAILGSRLSSLICILPYREAIVPVHHIANTKYVHWCMRSCQLSLNLNFAPFQEWVRWIGKHAFKQITGFIQIPGSSFWCYSACKEKS